MSEVRTFQVLNLDTHQSKVVKQPAVRFSKKSGTIYFSKGALELLDLLGDGGRVELLIDDKKPTEWFISPCNSGNPKALPLKRVKAKARKGKGDAQGEPVSSGAYIHNARIVKQFFDQTGHDPTSAVFAIGRTPEEYKKPGAAGLPDKIYPIITAAPVKVARYPRS